MTGASYYESVPAEPPAGSLIVYSDMLLHGTGANVSDNMERAGVIVGYCPPWCRPMINFPLALDADVMRETSSTLRQLLGYSSVSIGFDEQWEGAQETTAQPLRSADHGMVERPAEKLNMRFRRTYNCVG